MEEQGGMKADNHLIKLRTADDMRQTLAAANERADRLQRFWDWSRETDKFHFQQDEEAIRATQEVT
jgi:hypothetical protein